MKKNALHMPSLICACELESKGNLINRAHHNRMGWLKGGKNPY